MAWNGYGLYWAIIEMLRNESSYKLPLNKNTYRAIKMQTGTTFDVEKYLKDCINEYIDDESGNSLFNSDGKSFWSASLLRRLKKYEEIKEKRIKAANARWNKESKARKNTKKCKNIKGICKSNALAYKKRYKCNANIKKVYAKICKLNQIKLKEIKLKEMKSIYPSNHKQHENKNLDDMMDENEKMEMQLILNNCELHILQPQLAVEITEILKEMFMNPFNRKQILKLTSNNILFALKNFAIANTKKQIKIPKEYFKKCILSSLKQTALSTQYDVDTIYEAEE